MPVPNEYICVELFYDQIHHPSQMFLGFLGLEFPSLCFYLIVYIFSFKPLLQEFPFHITLNKTSVIWCSLFFPSSTSLEWTNVNKLSASFWTSFLFSMLESNCWKASVKCFHVYSIWEMNNRMNFNIEI